MPAYDGGLFSAKAEVSSVGAAIEALDLTNAEFGPPLAPLLVDLNDEGVFGAIDFRSLSVREFGTIYEGLLESDLSFAQSDLTLDKAGTYVPAREGAAVVVQRGERVPAQPVRRPQGVRLVLHQGVRSRASARPRPRASTRRPSWRG